MALDASTLTVVVNSSGITETTKALNDLAAAGEKAEKGTSNIGKGAAAIGKAANDAAKAGVDAAQQAASQYNAIIDMMTEKSNIYYSDKAMKAATAAQQELFDGMAVVDKLWAHRQDTMAQEAAARAKESADIRAQQQAILDAAMRRYAAEQDMANKMNAAYDKKQSAQQASDADAFTAALKRQADAIGMDAKQLKDYNAELLRAKAAQLGVSGDVEGYIKKIQSAKGAHEGLSLATAGSTREIIVMGHELMTGNINKFWGSLVVEANRINIVPSLLKPIAAAAEAVGVSMGVMVVAIGAVIAVTVGAITTYVKSVEALKELKGAVIETGGAVGATGDALYAMSNRIGAATGEFGTAREAILSLANTGKFTADQIGQITMAAVEMEKYGGVSVQKTTAMFEKLAAEPTALAEKGFKGVSNAAMELDKQLHFLEPSVLAHIIHLEQIGETSAASKVAIQALADAEKTRAEELKADLTPLGALLSDLAEKASAFWNALFQKDSKEDRLKGLQATLAEYDKHPIWSMLNDGITKDMAEQMRAEVKSLQHDILQDQYDADAKAHQARMNQLTNEQTMWLRNISDRMKGEESLAQHMARFDNVIAQQRERAKNDPAFAAANQSVLSDKSVAGMRANEERTWRLRTPKPKSDGLSGLDQTLAEISAEYEARKHAWDDEIKLVDFMQQHKLMSDSEAQKAKEKILGQEQNENKDALQKELDAIDAFHSKDTKLMEQAASKRAKIAEQMAKLQGTMMLKKAENGMSGDIFDAEAQDKADKAAQQAITTTVQQTMAIQAKIDAYNRLPESVRAAGVTEKQMQDEITQSEIEWYDEKIKSIAESGPESQKEVQRLTAERNALVEKTKAQKDWEAIQSKNSAALNASSALTKIATEQVKMWKDTGNQIEKALTDAFGNSGKAAGQMFKAFSENQAQQIDLANQIRVINENRSLSEQEKEKQTSTLRMQGAQDQINSYGNMASAASLFFEKGSTGYQAMTKAAEVLRVAEVALSVVKGVNAVLTQGKGEPYSAFARMAAMAAIVAGLGVAISGSLGGGGGSFSSADQQKIQGTGTVLGSPTITDGIEVKLVGEKSNSIANSLKIAEKNSGLGLVVQNDMLTVLQKMNDNIGSFATLVARDSNITNPDVGPLNSNNGTATKGVQVGTFAAIGSYFGPIGAAIGALVGVLAKNIPILGRIATSIFGGKQSVDDSGITLGSESLGSIAASGVNAQSYANITTSGGWFGSDKHNTQTQALGADFNNQITQVVLSMSDTLKTAAKGLGMDGDAFNQKLQSFVVDIGNISFKGMTGDEIQKTLQNVFSKLGDQMAQFAFSDLQKYQKIGEGLMETVVRVANDLQQVSDVFTVLGKTIPKTLDSIATSESLINQFGSVDNLTKGVKAYESAIYSDQEKLNPVIASVNSSMAALNLTGIETKEQFKSLVDGLDLTTDAGQQLFKALMDIAPTFGQVVDAAQKAAQDVATGLLTDVDNAFNALSKNVSKQKDAITKAADDATTAAQKQLDAAKTQQTAIQTVFDSVTSALQSLTSSTTETVTQWKWAEAQATVAMATASAAAGGDISKMGGLQDALNTLSKPDDTRFSTAQEAAMSNAQAANALTKFQNASKQQVDKAQLTIDKLNDTIKAIDDQKTAQLAALDSILSNAQDQIDSLKGQSASLMSIDQGIKALNAAIDKARANPLVGGVEAINNAYQNDLGRTPDSAGMAYWQQQLANGTPASSITASIANSAEAKAQINGLYQTLLHRNADQAGMDFWVNTLMKGGSLSDISDKIKASSEYTNLPSFDVGADNLPHDMIAQLHKGEAVVPAADNSQIKQRLQDGNNASVELSGKIDELVTVIKSGDLANVQVQKELLKIVKRWDTDGQPSTRDVNGV